MKSTGDAALIERAASTRTPLVTGLSSEIEDVGEGAGRFG
jgi:acyl-coenzyme A thioesterase PaaI-like protein